MVANNNRPGGTIVRPFNGSRADAEGLLAVEKVTFDESPYSGEEIQTMLTHGPQRAWLALAGPRIVGFVIAFATNSLHGLCWEIDTLAVHPDWRGRGLGRRLIRTAAAHGATVAYRARALVADDNAASVRAFRQVGFRPSPRPYRLLVYRTDKQPVPPPVPDVRVWEAVEEPQRAWTLLLAARGDQPVGYAELLQVETILYRGLWIESWWAASQMVGEALARAAVARAAAAALDEVGAVTPLDDRLWLAALPDSGFRSLGDFYWLTAPLPLPGLAGRGTGL